MADSSNPALPLPPPPSYLNDHPSSSPVDRKRRSAGGEDASAPNKRRKVDAVADTEARSIVNQKIRAPPRAPRRANEQKARQPPPGAFPFYNDDDPAPPPIDPDIAAAAAAAAAVRPFDPPPPPLPQSSALNDLAPAFSPSCFEEEDWLKDLEQEEALEQLETGRRPFCYLCKLGQEPGDEEENPFPSKMQEAWDSNYGNMADVELAELIRGIYEGKCRKHVEAGPSWDACPEWKTSTIYRHFTQHAVNDSSFNRWSKTQFQRMLALTARTGLVDRETTTGRRVLNPKGMKLFLDIHKRLQSIVSTTAMAGVGSGGGGAGAPLTSSKSSARGS